MKKYLCLIITHGNLCFELDKVSRKFLPLNIPVILYTNKSESIDSIINDAEKKINEFNPEKILIFVDLAGGSCWHAAMGLKKNHDNLAVFGGVNIPLLVSFATNIERLPWNELLKKLEEDALKAIKVIK